MGYKHKPVDLAAVKASLAAPNFLLKIIPHVDGTPRICELVEYYLEDITVKGAWTGPAALDLHAHALAPVAELPVLEVLAGKTAMADIAHALGMSPANIYKFFPSKRVLIMVAAARRVALLRQKLVGVARSRKSASQHIENLVRTVAEFFHNDCLIWATEPVMLHGMPSPPPSNGWNADSGCLLALVIFASR